MYVITITKHDQSSMTQATFLKSESAGGNFFSQDRNSESLRKLILVLVKFWQIVLKDWFIAGFV